LTLPDFQDKSAVVHPDISMHALPLSPFPSLRQADSQGFAAPMEDGYVDESVVLALLNGPVVSRRMPDPGHLVLAADEMDFAGWRLSPGLPRHSTEKAPVRRPAPPVLEEPGLGEPHHGTHRWWLAGLAGVLSTLVISLLLISLATRNHRPAENLSIIEPVVEPALEAAPWEGKRIPAPEISSAQPPR
jgi:hypothetical protein